MSATDAVRQPDVLVLAVGGLVGEAWMRGLLAGARDAGVLDAERCEHLVGSSAGSLVAAGIVAADPPPQPMFPSEDEVETPRPAASAIGGGAAVLGQAARLAGTLAEPVAGRTLQAVAPAGALARAAVLRRLPTGGRSLGGLRAEVDRRGARFDGRLRIVAVDRANGRRVVFGAPGAPAASVGQAVEASCAVPWIFRPARIGGREYVDGGVWSPTNLDVAPVGRGTEVLCLNPSGRFTASASDPINALRAAARPAAAVEAAALRRRGARVRVVDPDAGAARVMGRDFMAAAPRDAVLRAGYEQGRRLRRA